jgi:hypothetical protein
MTLLDGIFQHLNFVRRGLFWSMQVRQVVWLCRQAAIGDGNFEQEGHDG